MTKQEITAVVDRIIDGLDRCDFPEEAINWADLHCTEAKQYAGADSGWRITIEEADPSSSSFCWEIEKALFQRHQIIADVNTEW